MNCGGSELITQQMPDGLLDYLVANSELAKLLDPPVTIEDLFSQLPDYKDHLTILHKLPQLDADRFKLSNCLFDNTAPYDSLITLTNDDLLYLVQICDYFSLPPKLLEKLNSVINNGTDYRKYVPATFDKTNALDWTKIGDLRGIRCAHVYGSPLAETIFSTAATNGNLEVLQWLHKMKCPNYGVCAIAARNGHIECLKWLIEHNYPYDVTICANAAREGHLDCLKYIKEHYYPNPAEWIYTCQYAAEGGQLECLRYAHMLGCPTEWESVCLAAAQNGHVDCLRYAYIQGNPVLDMERIWLDACSSGSLDCLEYLYEIDRGNSWTWQMCMCAAANGHLDCLRYLHRTGCPWCEETCLVAAENGHLNCLQYAHTQGCRWPPKWEWADEIADGHIHSNCLEYIRTYGCTKN